jgi:SET domain-containing protein
MPNSVLSPLYCWFNYSCAPNSETGLRAVGSSAIEEQIATRNIEKGEEVYVSYIGDVDANKAVQGERLRTWLGNE